MQALRLGLIGCGNISSLYLKSIQNYPQLEVIACSDLDRSRAESLAQDFAIPQVLDTDELMASTDIEAIVNLTVPRAHARIAKQALLHGKDVYNEKPLATTVTEAKALVAMAKTKGLRLACAPSTFLGASVQTARQAIAAGEIGRPVAATALFMNHGMEHWHPQPESFYQAGAGPMFDIGPYYLTALVTLLGSAQSVTASASTSFTERIVMHPSRAGQRFMVNTPTHITGSICFKSGAIATVVTSFDVWHTRNPKFEVHGTDASLSLAAPNTFDAEVHMRRAQEETWRQLPFVSDIQDFERSWAIALADLADARQAGRPHQASGELALHVLELMQAFLTSAKQGRRVLMETVLPLT